MNFNSSENSSTNPKKKKKIIAEKEFSFSEESKVDKFVKRAKQIFSSDPLSISRKSVDEQGRVSMFRPIRLGFVNFYDFKFRLTNTISYARDLGNERSVSLGLNYSPLVFKDPFGGMKMNSWDLNLGYRKYLNNKYFFNLILVCENISLMPHFELISTLLDRIFKVKNYPTLVLVWVAKYGMKSQL